MVTSNALCVRGVELDKYTIHGRMFQIQIRKWCVSNSVYDTWFISIY